MAAENHSKKFRYPAAETAVITIASAMKVNVAMELRPSRSARDTTADMTYGIHAIKVERIGSTLAK
jgi:hypothetical protein